MNRVEQKQIVLDEFNKDAVREDQYNGENVLMRLAISILCKSKKESDDIVNILKDIDIKPEFVIIDSSKCEIDVWWFSQQNNVITNKEQYLRLIDGFIDYVDNLYFDKWVINLGMFCDDTTELDFKAEENLEIVTNPNFNSKNFGLDGDIQIHID